MAIYSIKFESNSKPLEVMYSDTLEGAGAKALLNSQVGDKVTVRYQPTGTLVWELLVTKS